jgi:hypothetical protein
MEQSDKTARQMFTELRADPRRRPFGFGRKPMLVNVDWQNAYTSVGEFATAYDNDPKAFDYVNELADLARARNLPVMWTYVAYRPDGTDCGVFGCRDDTPDSLQNVKRGGRRAALDPRLSRNQPRVASGLSRLRYRHRNRRLDFGLCSRDGRRQHVPRLPHHRTRGMCGGSA